MEVHPHSHTSGKKWTHYFWEFFMLFLAVTLGFLVENQREHYVEHQRAKVYAANLYNELKADTSRMNFIIGMNNFSAGKLDTFCVYSAEKEKRNITNGVLYYYGLFTTWIDFFSSSNTTIEQLKSSGNLRIMGNKVSHKISEYGKKMSDLENEYQLTRTEFEKLEDLYFKIFDGHTNRMISPVSENLVNRDSVFKLDIPLINDDPKLMKEFTGRLQFAAVIYHNHNTQFHTPLKKFIIELMDLLKKEYRLE